MTENGKKEPTASNIHKFTPEHSYMNILTHSVRDDFLCLNSYHYPTVTNQKGFTTVFVN